MERTLTRPALKPDLKLDMEATAGFIAGVQKTNGKFPVRRRQDGSLDHVESAMGLVVAGYPKKRVGPTRGWRTRSSRTEAGGPGSGWRRGDLVKGLQLSSYAAVGVFHYGLVTGDWDDAFSFWPMVEGGIELHWLSRPRRGDLLGPEQGRRCRSHGPPDGIQLDFMSVKCALAMAERQGLKRPRWEEALKKLGHAILYKPNRFNMIKSRFSMDWYYPVLCGALQGQDARRRIDRYWERFVVPDWGVRCVCDRPWATMAETSELVLALDAVGSMSGPRPSSTGSWTRSTTMVPTGWG